MTDLMKRAFAAASSLPADRQDDLARYILALTQSADAGTVSPEEAVAIAEAEAELASGQRAPQDAVDAFWRRQGS